LDLLTVIRDVPDFPKKGIVFKDITTLLQKPEAFNFALNEFVQYAIAKGIVKIAAIESRGFIFGGAIASKIGAGFVPIRKPGKLPSKKISESYSLEYGTDTIEIHEDAIRSGEKVILHDDLLATGGTMQAAIKLVERLGGIVTGISFLIELDFLKGRELLKGYEIQSLIHY